MVRSGMDGARCLVRVVKEYRLLGADVEACADQGVDPGIGLAHPGLM